MNRRPFAFSCMRLFSMAMLALRPTFAQEAAGSPATEAPPIVLALQTFFTRAQSGEIEAICREASRTVPGVKCAFDQGAVLHMTTGSWQVRADELEAAAAGFPDRIGHVAPLKLRVSFEEKSFRAGTRHYFFIPAADEALLAFHADVHRRLAYPFTPFRKEDRVGSWWPHVTLIEVPDDALEAAQPFLEKLRAVTVLNTTALALVTFGPIRTGAEVEMKE